MGIGYDKIIEKLFTLQQSRERNVPACPGDKEFPGIWEYQAKNRLDASRSATIDFILTLEL
jgi:hypothetical protein